MWPGWVVVKAASYGRWKTPPSSRSSCAICRNLGHLETTIDALRLAGFRSDDISTLLPDKKSSRDLALQSATKAPEGAATGAGAGLMLGGALGWLVGVGALAIPGLGPFIAAGPLMAALAGAGVGGAVGELAGGLIGFGLPEFEAKRYEGLVKSGGILLSVHADNSEWVARAKKILKQCQVENISSSGEASADSKSPVGYTLRPKA
jgi:hypothetical protein